MRKFVFAVSIILIAVLLPLLGVIVGGQYLKSTESILLCGVLFSLVLLTAKICVVAINLKTLAEEQRNQTELIRKLLKELYK